jgi:GTP-binding protein
VRHRRPATAARHGDPAGQEGGLIEARYLGSFPSADFSLSPAQPELAVIGRSNVGKSTLINALLGRRSLARTSRSPGKTQTCNVYDVGTRYYLLDLPGYGYAKVSKAQRAAFRRLLSGIVGTRPRLAGVLWLVDVRHPPSKDDHAMQATLGAAGTPVLLVVTKADKVARGKRPEYVRTILEALDIEASQCVVTSAETGEGIGDLRDSVGGLLGGTDP